MWVLLQSALRARNTYYLKHFQRPLSGLFLCIAQMAHQRIPDLLFNRKDRVQAGHWILENHTNLVTVQFTHFTGGYLRNILSVKHNFIRFHFGIIIQQVKY